MSFEIVKGDYGRAYVGIVRDVDYSDCTGKIYIWDKARTTTIINGKACTIAFVTPDTRITYVPALADFSTVASGIYYGMFEFLKSGVVEHTLEFVWRILEKQPV
jgi:hypothetical protein